MTHHLLHVEAAREALSACGGGRRLSGGEGCSIAVAASAREMVQMCQTPRSQERQTCNRAERASGTWEALEQCVDRAGRLDSAVRQQ